MLANACRNEWSLYCLGLSNVHRLQIRVSDSSKRRSQIGPPPCGCFFDGRAVKIQSNFRGIAAKYGLRCGFSGMRRTFLFFVLPLVDPPRRMTTNPLLP